MQLALMVATVGSITAAILKESVAPHELSPVMVSLQASSYSQEAWGGVTHQATSSAFVGDVDSYLVLCTFKSSADCHWTILSPELWLWGLCLEPQEMGGICLAVTTGLEGCNTSLHPGSWFGGCSFLVGFSVISAAASSRGELVCIGWALLGVAFSGYIAEGSSGRAIPLKMALSGKEM